MSKIIEDDDKRTSGEWNKAVFPNVTIIDPDGWDRKNFQHSFFVEKVTVDEFSKRMMESTVIVIKEPK